MTTASMGSGIMAASAAEALISEFFHAASPKPAATTTPMSANDAIQDDAFMMLDELNGSGVTVGIIPTSFHLGKTCIVSSRNRNRVRSTEI